MVEALGWRIIPPPRVPVDVGVAVVGVADPSGRLSSVLVGLPVRVWNSSLRAGGSNCCHGVVEVVDSGVCVDVGAGVEANPGMR